MTTVYHGTSLERAYQILQQGTILRTSPDTRRHADTHCGYVYVTKKLCDAMDFSSRPCIGETLNTIIVFKIEIEDSELLPDLDETFWNSTISTNGFQECFIVKRDLALVSDIKFIYVKRLISEYKLGEFLQNVNYGTIKIDESEWDSFHDGEDLGQRCRKLSNKLDVL